MIYLCICLGCTAPKNSASTSETDSETSSGESWPECAPKSVSNVSFSVGPDTGTIVHDPAINWPAGHHHAVCVVGSTSVVPAVNGDGLMSITIGLLDCEDDVGQPISLSLDVVYHSDVFTEAPPGIDVGRVVRVSYSTKAWQMYLHDAWYSLRDAETDELLLAVFSDPGPTVTPKVPGEPDLDNWLAPFDAALGEFGCAPGDPSDCSDGISQRAFVEFTRGDSLWEVLGTTEGDLGDYRVHLGFAGSPTACEGISSNNPIEGLVILEE